MISKEKKEKLLKLLEDIKNAQSSFEIARLSEEVLKIIKESEEHYLLMGYAAGGGDEITLNHLFEAESRDIAEKISADFISQTRKGPGTYVPIALLKIDILKKFRGISEKQIWDMIEKFYIT